MPRWWKRQPPASRDFFDCEFFWPLNHSVPKAALLAGFIGFGFGPRFTEQSFGGLPNPQAEWGWTGMDEWREFHLPSCFIWRWRWTWESTNPGGVATRKVRESPQAWKEIMSLLSTEPKMAETAGFLYSFLKPQLDPQLLPVFWGHPGGLGETLGAASTTHEQFWKVRAYQGYGDSKIGHRGVESQKKMAKKFREHTELPVTLLKFGYIQSIFHVFNHTSRSQL